MAAASPKLVACSKGQVPGETWLNDFASKQWLCIKFREIPSEVYEGTLHLLVWQELLSAQHDRDCSYLRHVYSPTKATNCLGEGRCALRVGKNRWGIILGWVRKNRPWKAILLYSISKIINFHVQQVSTRVIMDFHHQWWYKCFPQFPPLQEASFKSKSSPAVLRINDLSNSLPSIIDKILNT